MTNEEMKKALEEAGYMVLDRKQTLDMKEVERLAAKSFDSLNTYEIKFLLARIFPNLAQHMRFLR